VKSLSIDRVVLVVIDVQKGFDNPASRPLRRFAMTARAIRFETRCELMERT